MKLEILYFLYFMRSKIIIEWGIIRLDFSDFEFRVVFVLIYIFREILGNFRCFFFEFKYYIRKFNEGDLGREL